MPQSLARILIHAVFSTKNRYPLFTDKETRIEMHKMTSGISIQRRCPTIQVGGVGDHVHILFNLGRVESISTYIKEVKRRSTDWLQGRGGIFEKFHWQAGYGGFSIGQSQVETVIEYIANQEKHHAKKTFQGEFREFCEKYEVEYDEKYCWD